MGVRKLTELVGETDWLDRTRAIDHWKANGLDFGKLFHKPEPAEGVAIHHCETQNHGLEKALDKTLIAKASSAIETGKAVRFTSKITTRDRTAGAMLSGAVAKKHGHAGLADDTIWIDLEGTAGQSFGAWTAKGVTLSLTGEANDYVGKGLSGGKLIVRPHANSAIVPEESIIVGNTVMYGAIAGECYFRGVAGERFAVRNSGAIAVVEGTGDHGCEYMTGGVVVVLGRTGRNFAAGMSGGIAYVLDEAGDFERRCNLAMVDLEPVPAEAETSERSNGHGLDMESHGLVDIMSNMGAQDAERLEELIKRHMHYTGSARAKTILENWAKYLPKFRKVMPVDYKQALAEMAKQQAADTTGLGVLEIGLPIKDAKERAGARK